MSTFDPLRTFPHKHNLAWLEGRPVSRFFFHVFDAIVAMDEEGELADDLQAARTIAFKGARELLCEQISQGYLNLDNYIVIADQSGHELARVRFGEALAVHSVHTAD